MNRTVEKVKYNFMSSAVFPSVLWFPRSVNRNQSCNAVHTFLNMHVPQLTPVL